jgi:hypothetical protein
MDLNPTLIGESGSGSFSQGRDAVSYALAFKALVEKEPALLRYINVGAPIMGRAHIYYDDRISKSTVTLGASLDSNHATTALTLVSTAGLAENCLLYPKDSGEVIRVVSVTDSTTLVIARVSGQAEALDNGTVCDVSWTNAEAGAGNASNAEAGVQRISQLATLYDKYSASSIAANVLQVDGVDIMERERTAAMVRQAQGLNMMVARGRNIAPTGSIGGSFDGIGNCIRTADSANYVSAGGQLTENLLDQYINECITNGRAPNVLACSPHGWGVISATQKLRTRITETEMNSAIIGGLKVTGFRSDWLNAPLEVIIDRNLSDSHALLFNTEDCALRPLNGIFMEERTFSVEAAVSGNTGYGMETICAFEFRGGKAAKWIYGIDNS